MVITEQDSPIKKVNSHLFVEYRVCVDIKRDDLIHTVVSGNKWRKLKYLMADAKMKNCTQLLSMGGNWSNHLHALAYAGKEYGFKTVGFVRAHPNQALTATLEDCIDWGMELIYITNIEYSELRKKVQWDEFSNDYSHSYWISEGGFSPLAIQGITEINTEVSQHYDYIFTAVGSGATLIGLAKAFPQSTIIGVAAFKGAKYLETQLREQFPEVINWKLEQDGHCGGFAKINSELTAMIHSIEKTNDFKLDNVYNGKTFLALKHYVENGTVSSSDRVLVIHTGGLQGIRS